MSGIALNTSALTEPVSRADVRAFTAKLRREGKLTSIVITAIGIVVVTPRPVPTSAERMSSCATRSSVWGATFTAARTRSPSGVARASITASNHAPADDQHGSGA